MTIYINGDLYKWRFINQCKGTKNIDINKSVLKKSLFLGIEKGGMREIGVAKLAFCGKFYDRRSGKLCRLCKW